MTEREKLINRLKVLFKIHRVKLKKYQQDNNYSDDVGCITREGCIITSLYPKMIEYNIKPEDFNGT